jgi:hypothetical protein
MVAAFDGQPDTARLLIEAGAAAAKCSRFCRRLARGNSRAASNGNAH